MKNAKNKKTAAGWIAATLAFAVLLAGLGTGLFYLDRQNRANRLEIENFYQQSIYQMSESALSIEVNMSKLMVSGEPAETALLLNDTYHHSQSALNALNALPIDPWDKAVTERFLNQLSDWCLVMSKKALNGGFENGGDLVFAAYSNGNQNGYKEAAPTAPTAAAAPAPDAADTEKVGERAGEGVRKRLESFDGQSEELYIRAKRLAKSANEAANKFKDGYRVINNLSSGLMNGFDIAAENIQTDTKTPALVYDGPFSDSQNAKSFKGLNGKEEVSPSDAAKKAEAIFKNLGLRNVSLIGESDSPAAYAFCGSSNFGDMYVNVSKNGGIVLSAGVPCDNTGKKIRVPEEKCKELAVKYAEMCGYKELSPVWYAEAAGFAVVNLAPVKDDVVIYPDLVRVKVCRVTGDFKAIEATGFCTCHCDRDLTPAISAEEARRAVSSKLTVTECRLALIPKDRKEILCYEFAAEFSGLNYFIYIDASTGRQADIMRI